MLIPVEILVLICGALFAFCAASILFRSLAQKGVIPWHCKVTVHVAWTASFLIIILLPADIATAVKSDDPDAKSSGLTQQIFVQMWRVIYWTNLLTAYLFIRIQMSYVTAGEFSVRERLKRVGKDNAKLGLIGLAAIVLVVILGFVFFRQQVTNVAGLPHALIGLSNTYGLLYCILLLGYGSVEIPRHFWFLGDMKRTYRLCKCRAVQAEAGIEDAKAMLAQQMNRALQVSNEIPQDDDLRKYVDITLTACPPDFDLQAATNDLELSEARSHMMKREEITYQKIAHLHKDLKGAVLSLRRRQTEWDKLLESAWEAEDVVENMSSDDWRFRSSIRPARTGPLGDLRDRLEWIWRCRLQLVVFRILSLIFAMISIVIVWSEMTMFVRGFTLSPFGLLINASSSYFGIQFISALPLAYMCLCAYFTLFKLKIFSIYQMHFGAQTDAYSLVFNAAYIARLTAPLCYNYINLLNLDSNVTGFELIMGPAMKFLGFASENFNVYFPILIAVFCLLTVFNVWGRIGSKYISEANLLNEEEVLEGTRLLNQAKRQRERNEHTVGVGTKQWGRLDLRVTPPAAPSETTNGRGRHIYDGGSSRPSFEGVDRFSDKKSSRPSSARNSMEKLDNFYSYAPAPARAFERSSAYGNDRAPSLNSSPAPPPSNLRVSASNTSINSTASTASSPKPGGIFTNIKDLLTGNPAVAGYRPVR